MYVYFDSQIQISTDTVRSAVAEQLKIAPDIIDATLTGDGEGVLISVPRSVSVNVSARALAVQIGASRVDVSSSVDSENPLAIDNNPWLAIVAVGCSSAAATAITFFVTYL